MKKRLRINFSESAKEIKADVTLEYSTEDGEKFINSEVLTECKECFDNAKMYATSKTMQKLSKN